MSASLPYSVVIANNRILPSLKVVGNLDVSGNLTVDGNSRFNSTITDSTGSKGILGDYLTSNGASLPVSWTSTITVAPVRFFGRLTTGQVIPNATLTQITTYTSNVVNTGSGFNSATGRFTCAVSGNFNLFAQIMFLFDTGVGQETDIYMRIFNSANVLQETFISQNYNPTTPTFFVIVNSLNINYYMNSGDYAIILAIMSAGGGTRTVTEKSYFGGSRFSDTY